MKLRIKFNFFNLHNFAAQENGSENHFNFSSSHEYLVIQPRVESQTFDNQSVIQTETFVYRNECILTVTSYVGAEDMRVRKADAVFAFARK